jgi:hypothetical protein
VQANVTRTVVENQLTDVRELAKTNGWKVEADLEAPTVKVRMRSPVDDEVYVVHLDCEEFDEKPPYVEMVHPETGEAGHYEAYFDDRGKTLNIIAYGDGVKDPVLCHQYNRRIYEDDSTPHGNWPIADWQSDAGNLTTLGDIVADIHHRISDPNRYQGRYNGQR